MFYESFIMMVKANSHSNNHTLAEHPISRGRGAGPGPNESCMALGLQASFEQERRKICCFSIVFFLERKKKMENTVRCLILKTPKVPYQKRSKHNKM